MRRRAGQNPLLMGAMAACRWAGPHDEDAEGGGEDADAGDDEREQKARGAAGRWSDWKAEYPRIKAATIVIS